MEKQDQEMAYSRSVRGLSELMLLASGGESETLDGRLIDLLKAYAVEVMEDQPIDKGTGLGEQLGPVQVQASTTPIRYPRFLELQRAIRRCQELSTGGVKLLMVDDCCQLAIEKVGKMVN